MIKTFLPHFVSNPKDMKDLPKMHNFSYYFCVSLVICKQTLTRKKNIVPRDIEDIVCKPKKTCTINDHFWTMLFHLCVCVWKRDRERVRMGKLWKDVFSLVNSSNFASFWGNFLMSQNWKENTSHTQFIFPNICHKTSPKTLNL